MVGRISAGFQFPVRLRFLSDFSAHWYERSNAVDLHSLSCHRRFNHLAWRPSSPHDVARKTQERLIGDGLAELNWPASSVLVGMMLGGCERERCDVNPNSIIHSACEPRPESMWIASRITVRLSANTTGTIPGF